MKKVEKGGGKRERERERERVLIFIATSFRALVYKAICL
jgi:hypothetical protein